MKRTAKTKTGGFLKKVQKLDKKTLAVLFIAVVVVIYAATATMPSAKTLARPAYCDTKGCIPDIVFANLPHFPTDFNEVDVLVRFGQLPTMKNFTTGTPDEQYYLQPEFYPTWSASGIGIYTPLKEGYKPGYLGVEGYGAYPGDLVIRGANPGQTLEMRTFWHASWGIATYQGMSIQPVFPATGEAEGGSVKVTDQKEEEVRKYVSVTANPETVLIEPSYPFFQKGWSKPVDVKVTLSSAIPKGTYLIGLVPGVLPSDLKGQWMRDYRLKFVEAGGFVGIGRPSFQVFIVVE